ncbi:hypothetical protein F2P81_006386, partial [Scophthalmus maximus]
MNEEQRASRITAAKRGSGAPSRACGSLRVNAENHYLLTCPSVRAEVARTRLKGPLTSFSPRHHHYSTSPLIYDKAGWRVRAPLAVITLGLYGFCCTYRFVAGWLTTASGSTVQDFSERKIQWWREGRRRNSTTTMAAASDSCRHRQLQQRKLQHEHRTKINTTGSGSAWQVERHLSISSSRLLSIFYQGIIIHIAISKVTKVCKKYLDCGILTPQVTLVAIYIFFLKRNCQSVVVADYEIEYDRYPEDYYNRVFDYQRVPSSVPADPSPIKRPRPSSSSSSSSSTVALRMKSSRASSRNNNTLSPSSSSSKAKLKMAELLAIKRELTVIKVQIDGLLDCVDKMDKQRKDCS